MSSASSVIHPDRVQALTPGPPRKGRYVLYWMQASQRATCNHALEFAIERGNALGLPVVCVFGLTDGYPEANERHYAFMLEGLAVTARELEARGVRFVLRHADPAVAAAAMAKEAAELVADRGYLRVQRAWREKAAQLAACPMTQVESDAVVPVETASDKEEYAARTLRPRINRWLPTFLMPFETVKLKRDSLGLRLNELDGLDAQDVDGLLAKLKIDRSVKRVSGYIGGPDRARALLDRFIKTTLGVYAEGRNEPKAEHVSSLSPYLHFGQISPLEAALRVRDEGKSPEGVERFLEELIVRRELSINFVHYNRQYDRYECLPSWARATLAEQARKPRKETYTAAQLEAGETRDEYWNAAQHEMVVAGKMHNTMRMYWGKRILEWMQDPAEAFRLTLALNNKYELDGRDPNSFAGVAWCYGKHDRPWTPREAFGTVRSMTASGLERKYDIEEYVRKVEGERKEEGLFGRS
ncbi:MAG: deoxyribodipyrimidine photo-lyase [Planctomycetota bacterium]|nr:deoxyribodipyrimidine photo-lyase [Planctomycetota bacterium]